MTTTEPEAQLQGVELLPIYVASRASLPERGAMWRDFRSMGYQITSSWIDEDGEGTTRDFGELWLRIVGEIRNSVALVLYAEAADFPLKGALTEAGLALGMGKPVFVCLPDVGVLPRNYRPIGSWIAHPLVTRCDDVSVAMKLAASTRADLPCATADDESLLTALKAAANYICRAQSDHYDAETRDTVIKALTYEINELERTPRTTGETIVESAMAELREKFPDRCVNLMWGFGIAVGEQVTIHLIDPEANGTAWGDKRFSAPTLADCMVQVRAAAQTKQESGGDK